MLPRSLLALALAALAFAFAAPCSAQARAPRELPVFGAESRVVAVPVFVTDKAGRAVPGLTAADFEIEDQGERVPVVAFHVVDVGRPPAAGEAGAVIRAATQRQFLLLFDLVFSTPTGVLRARDAAIALVRDALAPSDLAAVATFGQRGVQVLVGFTPDRSQVERAITTLGVTESQPPARDPLNIAYDLGAPRWGPGIGPPPGDNMSQHLTEMARLMARGDQAHYRTRVDGFLEGMGQLARMFDAVQGRKQVILLSGGFDSSVTGGARGQESAEASEAVVRGRPWEVQSDRYFGDSAARNAFDELFRAVASTDTVIHSIDVGGLAASGAADSALPQPVGRGRDTLAQLASNTGGRFVADANDLRAGLAGLLEASRTYYVLAFEPLDPKKRPGRPRRLEVKAQGDGLSVSHRRAYVLADPRREAGPASAALLAAEAVAKGLSGGAIGLEAVAVPYRDAQGGTSLPVILQIDGHALSSGASSKPLGLEIAGYAFDGDGHVRDTMSVSPVIDRGAVGTVFEAKGLQIITSFAVPAGPVDLRFAVWDKASRRSGFLRVRLEMPVAETRGLVLSPPLAIDDPRARLVVPAPSRALPGLEIPFRLAEAPFTAELAPVLANGARREVCVLAWGEAGRDAGGSAYEVSAELVDGTGGSLKLPLAGVPRVVPDADRNARHVLTLAPRGVPAGRYVLRLAFVDPVSRAVKHSELPVRVD